VKGGRRPNRRFCSVSMSFVEVIGENNLITKQFLGPHEAEFRVYDLSGRFGLC